MPSMPAVARGFTRLLFVLGLLCGGIGVLAVAALVNWGDHERPRAHISVQPNGGAVERFVIRLPRDRILDSGHVSGLPSRYPADLVLSGQGLPGLHVEHFKLRDREGEVIGVAARHSQRVDEGTYGAWLLYLPGRGSLLLDHVESAGGLNAELIRRNLRPGAAWEGELALQRTAGPASDGRGVVRGGSREFTRHAGSYTETWRLTGVDTEGRPRGTIEIDTLTMLQP